MKKPYLLLGTASFANRLRVDVQQSRGMENCTTTVRYRPPAATNRTSDSTATLNMRGSSLLRQDVWPHRGYPKEEEARR